MFTRHCVALPLNFTMGLKDLTANTGETAVLEVKVSKEGAPMTWKKNGELIKPDGKKVVKVVEGMVYQLRILDLSLDDDAEYTCCYGDDESTCKLHVEGNKFMGCIIGREFG